MGKYSGILICTDFDGTFYNGDHVPQKNLDAIKYFQENGGLFTIASGRNEKILLQTLNGFDFRVPLICFNGARIYDAKKRQVIRNVTTNKITKEIVDRVLDELPFLTKINIHTLNGSLHILREDRETMTEELFGELYKVTFNYEKNKELSEETVLVMNKIVKDTGILVVRSTYSCTELVDPMGTKEKATAYLKEIFGAHTLVCVGDFENDIEMVRDADIGYAVENSVPSLKAVADRITVSVDEGAIAAIIDEL